MWNTKQKKTLTMVLEGLVDLQLRTKTLEQILKLLTEEREYKDAQETKRLQEAMALLKTRKSTKRPKEA